MLSKVKKKGRKEGNNIDKENERKWRNKG